MLYNFYVINLFLNSGYGTDCYLLAKCLRIYKTRLSIHADKSCDKSCDKLCDKSYLKYNFFQASNMLMDPPSDSIIRSSHNTISFNEFVIE